MCNISFERDHKQFHCFLGSQNMCGEQSISLLNVSIATSVITIILSITSTFANSVVILAVWKTSSLHTPSNLLLCCLAFADLCNAVVTQPSFVAFNVARIQGNVKVYCNASAVSMILGTYLCGVSFLTLTGVSFDRFLALHLHLRYRELVRTRAIVTGVVVGWVSVFFCYTVPPILRWYTVWQSLEACVIFISLILNALLYFSIFRSVHRHELKLKRELRLSAMIHGQLRKFKRRSWTVLYICLLYTFCYGPYVGSLVWSAITNGHMERTNVRIYGNIVWTAIFLCGTLNPILFCYRVKEIKKAIHEFI